MSPFLTTFCLFFPTIIKNNDHFLARNIFTTQIYLSISGQWNNRLNWDFLTVKFDLTDIYSIADEWSNKQTNKYIVKKHRSTSGNHCDLGYFTRKAGYNVTEFSRMTNFKKCQTKHKRKYDAIFYSHFSSVYYSQVFARISEHVHICTHLCCIIHNSKIDFIPLEKDQKSEKWAKAERRNVKIDEQ